MRGILVIAGTVILAEIGCLLRSTALTVQYGKFPVFTGTVIGATIAAIVGIYFADVLKNWLSESTISYLAGIVLIAIGIWIIMDYHRHT
jgi:putative Ca2+/H+ antiporter (TMEM165/GDT1 family)